MMEMKKTTPITDIPFETSGGQDSLGGSDRDDPTGWAFNVQVASDLVHSLFCVALKSKEKQIQREFATMA
jgi:hypothetical protein